MINHIDYLLRHLFMSEVTALRPTPVGPVTEDQIGFQPPDEDWRTHVSGLGTKNVLNRHRTNIRENWKLRSKDWFPYPRLGGMTQMRDHVSRS